MTRFGSRFRTVVDTNGSPTLVGSGVIVERIVSLPHAPRLQIGSCFNAELQVDPSLTHEVEWHVRSDDNVLPRVDLRLRDGVLHAELEDGAYAPLSELWIGARVGRLVEVKALGTARVVLQDLQAEAIALHGSGASRILARIRRAERVAVELCSSSEVRLEGQASELTLQANGTSRLRAERPEFEAEHARIELSGLSNARVCARESVSGRVRFPCQLLVACRGRLEIDGAYRRE
jgi:Putative auto-transporter adhesin, head GIN domain